MSKTVFMQKLRTNPSLLLGLILAAFFLKEVFLADIFPMFTGQDEARHYNTVQYLAYPHVIMEKPTAEQNKDLLETYNFSTEIKNTIVAAGLDANRDNAFDKMNFAPDSFIGQNENEINGRIWAPVNQINPPDIAGTTSLYHKLAAFIEKALAGQSILIRFYAARIFSILLGTLALFFFYLIIKNCGFVDKTALAMTTLISFQPRFSIYYVSVNYDALLILAFAVFAWAGTLLLKNGASWKNLSLLAASALLGYFDKGTGIVLIVIFIFIMAWLFWQRFSAKGKNFQYLSLAVFALAAALILYAFGSYLPLNGGQDPLGILGSLWQYFSKTLTLGRLSLTSRTYWGSLGWTDSALLDYAVNFIWLIEAAALGGLLWFLFSKNPPKHLPQKKYILFALTMVVALQLGIRLADWKYVAGTGKIALGAPGRYFIPNLVSHIILVFTGLGMLLRKKEYLEDALVLGAVLMFSFSAYLIFNVIIFRFYL